MKKNGKTHVQVYISHVVFSKEGKTVEKCELFLKYLATGRNVHHLDLNKNPELLSACKIWLAHQDT